MGTSTYELERIERQYQDAMMLAHMRYMVEELEAVSARRLAVNALKGSTEG